MAAQQVYWAGMSHFTSLGLGISSSVKWEDGAVCVAPAFQEPGGCFTVLLNSNLKEGVMDFSQVFPGAAGKP